MIGHNFCPCFSRINTFLIYECCSSMSVGDIKILKTTQGFNAALLHTGDRLEYTDTRLPSKHETFIHWNNISGLLGIA